jgi:hypothetical protein
MASALARRLDLLESNTLPKGTPNLIFLIGICGLERPFKGYKTMLNGQVITAEYDDEQVALVEIERQIAPIASSGVELVGLTAL